MNVILFDFDGVIVDSFSFCYRIIHTRDGITEDEYRARFEGNINDAPKKLVQSATSTTPFDFFEQYTKELLTQQPNQEIVPVIQKLAQAHTLIIISSTISPPIASFLELHNLKQYFKEILGNDVEKSKVKKIQDVLQRYNLQPSETVLITDTLGDIREANQCGVKSIAVTWGFHPVETLEKGQPYQIINTPIEIIDAIKSADLL
ncbi:HAD family hydrolase [Patescibacteria group bacterium]|nr:HAD family hydrolase [Patescibacteria group bacterium]MBP9710113.1 HAD family hydrolase [Patescibacteria group bacterium]